MQLHIPSDAITGRGCPELTRIHPGLRTPSRVALLLEPLKMREKDDGSRWPMGNR